MSTCRLCGDWGEQRGTLVPYSVRHYVHVECGLKRWGVAFFDRLMPWQVRNLPPVQVSMAGFLEEWREYVAKLPTETAGEIKT
jgi:hypothetical protein